MNLIVTAISVALVLLSESALADTPPASFLSQNVRFMTHVGPTERDITIGEMADGFNKIAIGGAHGSWDSPGRDVWVSRMQQTDAVTKKPSQMIILTRDTIRLPHNHMLPCHPFTSATLHFLRSLMRYLPDIKEFIALLMASDRFHILTILGAPGWAKTHGTRRVLSDLGATYELLGSYSTPLALFNKLAGNPEQILIIDDCAGIFQNPQAMSILNAASWPSAEKGGNRRVIWTSTSEKAATDAFDFRGKIIVLTNFIPESPQGRAFVNRALNYRIEIPTDQIGEYLLEAAKSQDHYPDSPKAKMVAEFLAEQIPFFDAGRVSLRTLDLGYEFAVLSPHAWQELLLKALPKATTATDSSVIVGTLNESTLRIEDQAARFSQMTGQSRRTFFYLRDKLGLKGKLASVGNKGSKKSAPATLRH